jgi:hypothetical protein
MSVLNRKLFKMHTGGTVPPHAPPGHLHTYDPELSDQEITSQLSNIQSELDTIGETVNVEEAKGVEQDKVMSGIMEGFEDDTVKKAVVPAFQLAESLYPTKSKEEYLEDAKELYPTDVSEDKAFLERQREEDKIAGLLSLGLGLLGGRGKPMEILAQAGSQALGAYVPLRAATRKEEAALVKEERALKTAQKKYALTQQQTDEANRLKLITDATFANIGFLQEMTKQDNQNKFELKTKTIDMYDIVSGTNKTITLEMLQNDMAKKPELRQYSKEIDMTKPFEVFDKTKKTNVLFTSPELFKEAQDANPNRYLPASDDVKNPVKRTTLAKYIHPVTGETVEGIVQELKDGTFTVPNLTADGKIILDTNGAIAHIPNTDANLIPMQDVALTKADILPPEKLQEQLGAILLYDRQIRSLDKVIANIIADPERAGAVGQIKDFIQRGKGIISDVFSSDDRQAILDSAIADAKFSHLDPKDAEAIRALFDPSEDGNSAAFWGGNFDTALAENRTRINGVAYVLARARKSSGRLNLDDIQRAYADLQITGVIDARSVLVKLNTIREELAGANDDMKLLFSQGGGAFPPGYEGVTGSFKATSAPKLIPNDEGGYDLVMPDEAP